MAQKKKRTAKKKGSSSSRTTAKKAGKPTKPGAVRAAAMRPGPTSEDLDLRDRLKSGPRRQDGPPLSGDVPTVAAMRALREEVIPAPTDPGSPKRKTTKKKATKRKTTKKKGAKRKTSKKKGAKRKTTKKKGRKGK